MAAVTKTLAGTLKPGGQLLLSDFENNGKHALLFHPESKHKHVERHGVTRDEMESILKQAELHTIKVENSFSLDKTVHDLDREEVFPFLLGEGTK